MYVFNEYRPVSEYLKSNSYNGESYILTIVFTLWPKYIYVQTRYIVEDC